MNCVPLHDYDLVLFDFDGTLYDSEAHFARYIQFAADHIPEQRAQMERTFTEVLQKNSTLRIGDWFDPVTKSTVAMDRITGEKPAQSIYLGDYWWIVYAIGSIHGIDSTQMDEAFLRTRTYMMEHPAETRLLTGLQNWLKETSTRQHPICCLATNSPAEDSTVILQALGIREFFADITYAAQKPRKMLDHLQRLSTQFSVAPERILSIGDHYYNDVEPAILFGADGLLINRHTVSHRRNCTYEVSNSEEVMTFLRAL